MLTLLEMCVLLAQGPIRPKDNKVNNATMTPNTTHTLTWTKQLYRNIPNGGCGVCVAGETMELMWAATLFMAQTL